VFAEYGNERAQLSYMSKIAGISIGLIGQNFGSKQELFLSVVRDGYDNLHKIFNDIGENKSVKELEKTPVADALRIGQKSGEVKDGHPGILYALFFRTACNIIVSCNKNNIALPEDEWFLSLVRK